MHEGVLLVKESAKYEVLRLEESGPSQLALGQGGRKEEGWTEEHPFQGEGVQPPARSPQKSLWNKRGTRN